MQGVWPQGKDAVVFLWKDAYNDTKAAGEFGMMIRGEVWDKSLPKKLTREFIERLSQEFLWEECYRSAIDSSRKFPVR